MSEEAALPYETTEPGYVPLTFCVPADVLNRHIGVRTTNSSTADEDEQ